MKIGPTIVLPILILAVAGTGAWALVKFKPKPETQEAPMLVPRVRTMVVRKGEIRIDIGSQGTVVPPTQINLAAEVSGRITWVSPKLVSGGFFENKQELVKLDRRDYELEVKNAEANVAQAEVLLAREQAEADIARKEWETLGKGKATPLTIREPQIKEAKARVASTEAMLARANLNLERTVVRAPFAGRVRTKSVDLGQFVNRGAPLAAIYATDWAEVRLPLHDNDLRYLDIPLNGSVPGQQNATVVLETRFAGATHRWEARIARTEGEIDPKSRQVHAVARIRDPYGRKSGEHTRPPLAVGLYVRATIKGKPFQDVVRVSRDAIRDGSRVIIVEPDELKKGEVRTGRLRYRNVEVLRAGTEFAIISSGLEEDDLVCLSPLTTVVDGMRVEIANEKGEVREHQTPNGDGR